MIKTKFNYCGTRYVNCFPQKNTLKIIWNREIPDNEINKCLYHIKSLIDAMHVQTLMIDSSRIQKSALSLDWKIIESSWQSFYNNGGKKIIVVNKHREPNNIETEYINIIIKNGIPIELEYREIG